jgi:hypothetical protein
MALRIDPQPSAAASSSHPDRARVVVAPPVSQASAMARPAAPPLALVRRPEEPADHLDSIRMELDAMHERISSIERAIIDGVRIDGSTTPHHEER